MASKTVNVRLRQITGTRSELLDKVPLLGELVYETDTRKLKIGDGTNSVRNLLEIMTVSDLPRISADVNELVDGSRRGYWREYPESSKNAPSTAYYHIFTGRSVDEKYGTQLALGMTTNDVAYRKMQAGNWDASWTRIITTNNYKNYITPSSIGASATSHTHNYAGSNSAGGSANSVSGSLTISLNGTSQGAYNGSSSKTVNITASSVGAAASSHSHSVSQITGLTAARALISDSSGHPAVSAVTSTELGYLDGVTSSIQTQLNGKASTSHSHSYAASPSTGGGATYSYIPRVEKSANYSPGGSRGIWEEYTNSSKNTPSAYWYHIFTGQGADANYNTQLALGMTINNIAYRNRQSGTWGSWNTILTSSNYKGYVTPANIEAATTNHTHSNYVANTDTLILVGTI